MEYVIRKGDAQLKNLNILDISEEMVVDGIMIVIAIYYSMNTI